jgi:L-seryl-tRNA(Ser) seleniumtransferase
VRSARQAIATAKDNPQATLETYQKSASDIARGIELALITPVINATGVLLHTNLGRAPLAVTRQPSHGTARATSLEFNMATGSRGSRQSGLAEILCELTGAEDALVVNNNAAAVLLVLAAVAAGRDVTIARGESVEIGGGFRIPDVLEQSGARLVDVGTTNRTRTSDYKKAIEKRGNDVAAIMRIHPSNFHIEGFTEQAPLRELTQLGVPVIVDIGSGLLDANCPWLGGTPPQWLANEPAAAQALHDGAALVTFSGDKLLGGPQCGIIVGARELIGACREHPLMRAVRPGSHVILALQDVLLDYVAKRVSTTVPFWAMASAPASDIEKRAVALAEELAIETRPLVKVVPLQSLPGAGSTPGASIASFGLAVAGDHVESLRMRSTPIVARSDKNTTLLDLRSVDPRDDNEISMALNELLANALRP